MKWKDIDLNAGEIRLERGIYRQTRRGAL